MRKTFMLSTKLLAMGMGALLVALASIGFTLWVAWQLEGGAAAVNEAGRLRMNMLRMILAQQNESPQDFSRLEQRFEAARLRNLRALGYPIERVIATGHRETACSPKAAAVESIGAQVFVDDYLPYFRGVAASIHTALVLRAPNGSPNSGPELGLASSVHQDLAAFAESWLAR